MLDKRGTMKIDEMKQATTEAVYALRQMADELERVQLVANEQQIGSTRMNLIEQNYEALSHHALDASMLILDIVQTIENPPRVAASRAWVDVLERTAARAKDIRGE